MAMRSFFKVETTMAQIKLKNGGCFNGKFHWREMLKIRFFLFLLSVAPYVHLRSF